MPCFIQPLRHLTQKLQIYHHVYRGSTAFRNSVGSFWVKRRGNSQTTHWLYSFIRSYTCSFTYWANTCAYKAHREGSAGAVALRPSERLPGGPREGRGFEAERQASAKRRGTAGHVGKTPRTPGLMGHRVPGLETWGRRCGKQQPTPDREEPFMPGKDAGKIWGRQNCWKAVADSDRKNISNLTLKNPSHRISADSSRMSLHTT